MKKKHPYAARLPWALAVLCAGFLLGKGAARALDLGNPPGSINATTTVGLTPEPPEGQGQPGEAEETDDPGTAAPTVATPEPAGNAVDEDESMEPSMAPLAPRPRRFEVGAQMKHALDTLKRQGKNFVAQRGNVEVPTTLDPDLQEAAQHLLSDYRVPGGAVVALHPKTGRVLAVAGYADDHSFGRELALVPLAPAASVFKMVTASALLAKGVPPEKETCFSGGKHRVVERDLTREGSRCVTLAQAMAKSANVVFAKLTQENLEPKDLSWWANTFLFNTPLPWGVPASPANIPAAGMDFYRTGAGFGDVRMSAWHGALLAATVANQGVMPTPVLFAGEGEKPLKRVMDPAQAATLGAMMELTVTEGTARRAFRERHRPVLGDVRVAGKTGSLAEQAPFRDYSWFVGYAPANNPTVAVAVMVMNNATWRVRASYVAREVLRAALIKGHHVYRPLEERGAPPMTGLNMP